MKTTSFFFHPGSRHREGFTLVELMIALAISLVIMMALSTAYIAQQKSQVAQDQVIEMQQNLRSLATFFSSEIRLAGYAASTTVDAGISNEPDADLADDSSTFTFTYDKNEDGLIKNEDDEYITYGFICNGSPVPDDDGFFSDGSAESLCRKTNSTGAIEITNNICGIEFLYVLDNDDDDDSFDTLTTLSPTTDEYEDIRAIKISILARADRPDDRYYATSAYTTASGKIIGPFNDHYRRRMLITTVQLRNMGL